MPLFDHLMVPLYPTYQQVAAHQFGYYALPTQLPVFGAGLILFRLLGPDRSTLARLEHWLPARPRARSLLGPQGGTPCGPVHENAARRERPCPGMAGSVK